MRRFFSREFMVLAIVSVFVALVGCTDSESISVAGTWESAGTYGTERWVITDTSITYSSDYGSGFSTVYRADVVDFSNDGLNAGDTALTSSGSTAVNPGFAVIRYTAVNNPGTGEVGTYNVFRWADNARDGNNRDFTQGYKDADLDGDPSTGTYTNLVFDTASAAESGASVAKGYFSYASTGAEPQ